MPDWTAEDDTNKLVDHLSSTRQRGADLILKELPENLGQLSHPPRGPVMLYSHPMSSIRFQVTVDHPQPPTPESIDYGRQVGHEIIRIYSQARSAAENATPLQDWTISLQYTNSGALDGTMISSTDKRPLRWYTALVQVPDTSRGAHRTLADRGRRDSNSLSGMWNVCRQADTMVAEGHIAAHEAGVEWRYIIHNDPQHCA